MEAAPRTRRRWWLLAVPIVVGVVIIAIIALAPGQQEPGKRTRIVLPAGTSAAAFKSAGIKLELAPELREDFVQADLGAMMGSSEQSLFMRRETMRSEIFVTSARPVQSSAIRYTLFDAAGDEISTGVLWPDVALQPNVRMQLFIGDFELGRATKVVLSKSE